MFQSVAFIIISVLLSILAIKFSPGLNGNRLSSTKAFSKNIECLNVGFPAVDFDSTLYNLVLVWETTITSPMSRVYKYILQVTVIDMPMYVHILEFNVYTWQVNTCSINSCYYNFKIRMSAGNDKFMIIEVKLPTI
jgi:hypothetical protein